MQLHDKESDWLVFANVTAKSDRVLLNGGVKILPVSQR